jgi:hypothetical protein
MTQALDNNVHDSSDNTLNIGVVAFAQAWNVYIARIILLNGALVDAVGKILARVRRMVAFGVPVSTIILAVFDASFGQRLPCAWLLVIVCANTLFGPRSGDF